MKFKSYIFRMIMAAACVGTVSSCQDMLEMDSDYVIYSDEDHLSNPADTANSLIGIISKLQAIGDRTNLLGELRGDLVDVRTSAHADLRNIANFNITDDNKYNNPRDYYAIINNCNYYLAYADTAAIDNRNDRIFEREFAQVKTIRAWVYLQLALNYGKVPFYTEPILKESDANKEFPKLDLQGICDYFITDIKPYIYTDFPSLKKIGSIYMGNCMFPVDMVLGDLYLWRASLTHSQNDYREAAKCYYRWINDTRIFGDGTRKSVFYTNPNYATRFIDFTTNAWRYSMGYTGRFPNANYDLYNMEFSTIIPMDSASSSGYYSEVRGLYNSTVETTQEDYYTPGKEYVIYPSPRLREISRSQSYYLLVEGTGGNVEVKPVPEDMFEDQPEWLGDLRFKSVWSSQSLNMGGNNKFEYQTIQKTDQRHIWIYRQTDAYLRLAEALNNGGYPRFAYAILATGIGKKLVNDSVQAYCTLSDSLFLETMNTNNEFSRFTPRNGMAVTSGDAVIGIHSYGSGYAEKNPDYAYPGDSVRFEEFRAQYDPEHPNQWKKDWANDPEVKANEQLRVDSMILEEMALETSFEGKRFYDLMRFAYRRGNEWLADPISKREGLENPDLSLKAKLMDRNNWYLSWKGKIGLN